MDRDLKIKTVTVPMYDTGIGREAGFKDDAELIEVARKQRDTLPPEIRALVAKIDAEFERQILFGK